MSNIEIIAIVSTNTDMRGNLNLFSNSILNFYLNY